MFQVQDGISPKICKQTQACFAKYKEYNKRMKHDSKLEIEKEFLMKMTNQIDTLTNEVKVLKEQKPPALATSRFNFSVTFSVSTLEGQTDRQKLFIDELKGMIQKYLITRLSVDYKK